MHPKLLLPPVLLALAAVGTAQCNPPPGVNPNLPRGETRLNAVPGICGTGLTNNLDAGFGTTHVVSPEEFVPAGGGSVATSQLVYAAYADQDAMGNVVVNVRTSVNGGLTWNLPVTAYTCDTANGEDLNPPQLHPGSTAGDLHAARILLAAYGNNEVYLGVFTNKDDNANLGGNNGHGLYVTGSNTQGQTFAPPVRVDAAQGIGGTKFDFDELQMDATSSGLHLVYEYDAVTAFDGPESLSYAKLGWTGGTFALLIGPMDITPYPANSADVDAPDIAAEGNLVHISWSDNATSANLSYSVQSFDGGTTFSTPFLHNSTATSVGRTRCEIDGTFIYTFMEDRRGNPLDTIYMDRGDIDLLNSTVNWNNQGILCSTNGGADVDDFEVDVHEGTLAILYRDNRVSSSTNLPYLTTDSVGGDQLIAGTITSYQLNTATAGGFSSGHFSNIWLDVSENVIAAVVYDDPVGPDGMILAASHDRGATMDIQRITTQDARASIPSNPCGIGTRDVDNPRIAVTRNGDMVIIYNEDDGNQNCTGCSCSLVNTCNQVYITGTKYPYCEDMTMVNGTITWHRGDPMVSDEFIIALASITPNPGGLTTCVGGNTNGICPDLIADPIYGVIFANALALIAFPDANGDATITLMGNPIPPPTAVLGMPVWGAAASGNFQSLSWTNFCNAFSFQ